MSNLEAFAQELQRDAAHPCFLVGESVEIETTTVGAYWLRLAANDIPRGTLVAFTPMRAATLAMGRWPK